MPDHRYMYPKVVPVAAEVKPATADAAMHNFAPANLRNSLQPSRSAATQPKTATSL